MKLRNPKRLCVPNHRLSTKNSRSKAKTANATIAYRKCGNQVEVTAQETQSTYIRLKVKKGKDMRKFDYHN